MVKLKINRLNTALPAYVFSHFNLASIDTFVTKTIRINKIRIYVLTCIYCIRMKHFHISDQSLQSCYTSHVALIRFATISKEWHNF